MVSCIQQRQGSATAWRTVCRVNESNGSVEKQKAETREHERLMVGWWRAETSDVGLGGGDCFDLG